MKIDSLQEYCKSIYELMNIPMMIYRKSTGKIETGFFVDHLEGILRITLPCCARRRTFGACRS